MKCIYADTNVFLRFLTKDVPDQADRAEAYLRKAEKGKLCMTVMHITILEILFQLERFYDLSRAEAVAKVALLIEPDWLRVDNKKVVMDALYEYERYTIDFVDILTWCMAKAEKVAILSFDKDFDTLKPSIRIEP
ncbi:MAG: PIN domain-containing protein [bacterium]|nr:PIN domain-containing protein [bacterium]